MGFEVFIECLANGSQGLPLQKVLDFFSGAASETAPEVLTVLFDKQNRCTIYFRRDSAKPDNITGLTVQRPCGDRRLWDALFQTMQAGPAVLFFPGSVPLVPSSAAAELLPSEMTDALGQPVVVTSGSDIVQAIENS